MNGKDPYEVRLATTEADLLGAQRLRYQVFVEEMGGDGPLVDHRDRLERDAFDPFATHLVMVDTRRDPQSLGHVIGAYRLLSSAQAEAAGGFYCVGEYDLTPLLNSGERLLELGRSCLDPRHRGGDAIMRLWARLAEHVRQTEIRILFGVASFAGTDVDRLAGPLSLLHHRHLAPDHLRVRSLKPTTMDRIPMSQLDRIAAARDIPPLLKSYLRLGGVVGEGAFVDETFNTTDVCVIMDVAQIPTQHRARYVG